MPPMVKESLWAPESTTKGLGELVLICVLVCNLATSLGRHSVPCAAPPAATELGLGSQRPLPSSIHHRLSAWCLLLGGLGLLLSRTHMVRGRRVGGAGVTGSTYSL